MTDITMCQQEECPKSWWCWRFNAPPDNDRQSYFAPEFTDDGCDSFLSMEEDGNLPSPSTDAPVATSFD